MNRNKIIIAEYCEKVSHHELQAARAEEQRRILQEELWRQQKDFRDTVMELSGRLQELQNEVNCTSDSKDFQDAESVRSGNSTLPINRCYSLNILFLKGC